MQYPQHLTIIKEEKLYTPDSGYSKSIVLPNIVRTGWLTSSS